MINQAPYEWRNTKGVHVLVIFNLWPWRVPSIGGFSLPEMRRDQVDIGPVSIAIDFMTL